MQQIKSLSKQIDEIGQVITGATVLLSDLASGRDAVSDPRTIRRIQDMLSRLDKSSGVIYGFEPK